MGENQTASATVDVSDRGNFYNNLFNLDFYDHPGLPPS